MGWQDSFTPDMQAPQAVQAQGWQSSFVPDGQQSPPAQQTDPYENIRNSIPAAPDFLTPAPGSGLDKLTTAIATSAPPWTVQAAASGIQGAKDLMNLGQPEHTENPQENQMTPAALGDLLMVNPSIAMGATPYTEGAGSSLISPTSKDIKLIQQKLELAGVTPRQYADALTNSSPQDFAGELGGDPLRMQTQAQAKITGPAMQEARDAMRQRLAEAPQRTQQIIENAFFPSSSAAPTVGADPGLAASPLPQIEPIAQMQKNLVDIKDKLPDLYEAANNSTINPTVGRRASLGVINTPAGQQAMKDTVANLANQGIRPEQAGIVIDPENGFHGLATKVPVNTLGELQKSLGDQVTRNPMTGAIEDHSSQVIEGMRQHITNYLSENSPEFNTANTNAAANFQGTNAFEMGRKLAHSAAGENADALMQRATDSFSPQELSYFKGGYAQGLSDTTMGTALGSGSPASRIAKGTVTQTASDIIGPTEAQKFADALMQEKNKVDLAQRALYGSNTAETLTSGVPEVPTSIHGAGAAAFNKVKDFLQAGRNERLAQLLYATSPEQKALLASKVLGQ